MITPADILRAKILIVDDKAPNVLLLERMLQGAGYVDVTSTMDASSVCQLHLENAYHVILLDLQMPGMDGFQVMENLKEIEVGSYLPVLVVTARPDHKLRALRAGAKDFVSKPLDLAEVLLRIHNMIEVRLLHAESRLLHQRLLAERAVSEHLLRDLLPGSVVERLQHAPRVTVDGRNDLVTAGSAEVAVVFASILEFTSFCEGASATVLVGVLDDLSARLAGAVDAPGQETDDVIGNALLAAAGLPDALADLSTRTARRAVELAAALDRFNAHSRCRLKVRIGFERGAVGAGAARARKVLHEL